MLATIDFELPAVLEAGEPPEARGLERDQVRLMVSHSRSNQIEHYRFDQLATILQAGDVLAINTSGTLNAAIPATNAAGERLIVHLSTQLLAELWLVEVRQPYATSSQPYRAPLAGSSLNLPSGGQIDIHRGYANDGPTISRLWVASLRLPQPLPHYLAEHAKPIHYQYVANNWPNSYYQTVYATELGSAEMPSAGRAFSERLLTRLVAQGIQIAPLLLHTGVASLEDHEPPYAEWYSLPATSADLINRARADRRRVIAVGTTSVRAIESTVDQRCLVHPQTGWTELVITPERGLHAVDGILTGLHEPKATHLAMLAALAGYQHLDLCYREALDQHYLWHEFGDLHLILP
ncbi:MAG: S-adenosylmethionine:tRNA ribosyltransferase-isomerase [Chloroflexi bacterium]|nr:S-adenosylmethionine:tRNA ribosyltransferase-isomerase [Chloroflexota bacterium]